MTVASKTLRTAAELLDAGLIAPDQLGQIERVAAQYAVAITPAVAELIAHDDPHDPLARQFVPDAGEVETHPHEMADPIGDSAHNPVEGIVHRYPDRVLLKLVHVCPVYCRFCFRREMVGPKRGTTLSRAAFAEALAYIRSRPEIWEVVLTGGDPLILSPRRIREVVTALSGIDHVKVLRWHTRVPVVTPERVTQALARALRVNGKASYVVLHANHARELTPSARAACARLIDAGVPMLSQSVLLKGVNDDPNTLGSLMRAFVETRIKPYYLHHGDLAPGTARFRTSINEGQRLMRALRGHLSGLCQPAYVLDIPGGHGKSPIGPSYLVANGNGHDSGAYLIEDYTGRRHAYPAANPMPATERENQ
jgi:lysine 2,3-aminomutase